jgi:hypothetical protein
MIIYKIGTKMDSLQSFAVVVFVLLFLYFTTSKLQENMALVFSPSTRNKSLGKSLGLGSNDKSSNKFIKKNNLLIATKNRGTTKHSTTKHSTTKHSTTKHDQEEEKDWWFNWI